jgi:Flp pilus assembly protein TadG
MKRTERGGATIEMTLIAPLLILMLLLVVGFGRVAYSRGQVDGAARDGARAASIARSESAATEAARKAVSAHLQASSATCRTYDVGVDTSQFEPGGWVAVDVTCNVSLGDLSLLRIPGTKSVHERFVSPIDLYRGAQ